MLVCVDGCVCRGVTLCAVLLQSNEALARSFATRLSPYFNLAARPTSCPLPTVPIVACRFVSHCGVLQQRNSYDCGVFVLAAADTVSRWVEQGEQGDLQNTLATQCTQQAVTAYRQRLAGTVRQLAAEANQQQRQKGRDYTSRIIHANNTCSTIEHKFITVNMAGRTARFGKLAFR